MICFTVWWSLKVIIVLLHSLDKSRRLCVSVFTHYPVTATKPTQQKLAKNFRAMKLVRIIPFGANQGSRCLAELHKATVRRCYSLTHGSWMWGCRQWLQAGSGAAHRTQHPGMFCGSISNRAGQWWWSNSCKLQANMLTKSQQTGRQNCTTVARIGLGCFFFFKKVRANLNGLHTNLIGLAATAHFCCKLPTLVHI